MLATYNLCMKLISIGKSDIVNANIDLYLANNRLTDKEYNDIMEFINPKASE